MKRIKWRWVAAATAVFCVFLVMTLPARHVLGWLGLGQVAMQGIEGTPWHGRVSRLAAGRTVLGPVVWKFRPLSLFAGRLEYQLFLQSGSGGGELRVGRGLFGAPYISDAQLSLPAAEIARQLPLSMATLDGAFLVDITQASIASGWLSALSGQLVWQDAQVVQPAQIVLGSLQMTLSLENGQVVGALSEQPGSPLELGGEFRLGQDRRYTLDALVKPRAEADQSLRQALGLLGRPDTQGRYRLQLSGAL